MEGELGASLGMRQSVTFNQRALSDQRTPNMMAYNGNVILHPAGSDRAVVP